MASRRVVPQEMLSRADDTPQIRTSKSDITPAVPSAVVFKLLAFTLAMVTVPIGTYFATVNSLFRGNASYAGGLAAVMANVVVVAYVIVAIREDQGEDSKKELKDKKGQ